MEDHQVKLNRIKKILSSFSVFIILLMAGCQTVQMPDMSDFKLDLPGSKNMVTIKQQYGKVNIRPTPSTNQQPVAILKGGDQVTLKSEHGNWLNVTFYDTAGNEQVGWVYKYLVVGYEKPAETTTRGQTLENSPDDEEDSIDQPKKAADDISIL